MAVIRIYVDTIEELPAARAAAEAILQEGDELEIGVIPPSPSPVSPAIQERKAPVGGGHLPRSL